MGGGGGGGNDKKTHKLSVLTNRPYSSPVIVLYHFDNQPK